MDQTIVVIAYRPAETSVVHSGCYGVHGLLVLWFRDRRPSFVVVLLWWAVTELLDVSLLSTIKAFNASSIVLLPVNGVQIHWSRLSIVVCCNVAVLYLVREVSPWKRFLITVFLRTAFLASFIQSIINSSCLL